MANRKEINRPINGYIRGYEIRTTQTGNEFVSFKLMPKEWVERGMRFPMNANSFSNPIVISAKQGMYNDPNAEWHLGLYVDTNPVTQKERFEVLTITSPDDLPWDASNEDDAEPQPTEQPKQQPAKQQQPAPKPAPASQSYDMRDDRITRLAIMRDSKDIMIALLPYLTVTMSDPNQILSEAIDWEKQIYQMRLSIFDKVSIDGTYTE